MILKTIIASELRVGDMLAVPVSGKSNGGLDHIIFREIVEINNDEAIVPDSTETYPVLRFSVRPIRDGKIIPLKRNRGVIYIRHESLTIASVKE